VSEKGGGVTLQATWINETKKPRKKKKRNLYLQARVVASGHCTAQGVSQLLLLLLLLLLLSLSPITG